MAPTSAAEIENLQLRLGLSSPSDHRRLAPRLQRQQAPHRPRATHPSRVRPTVDHDPPTPSRIATGPPNGSPSHRPVPRGGRRRPRGSSCPRRRVAAPARCPATDRFRHPYRVQLLEMPPRSPATSPISTLVLYSRFPWAAAQTFETCTTIHGPPTPGQFSAPPEMPSACLPPHGRRPR